ncbi:hypothetical protein GCM10009863_12700 [Streptomyces axinellae]|uniref:Uncharacterized protein n=1 Tax=Streptomyces axinellae TaxID=552788 RepID=A0ABP6C3K7_9ACTN
MWNAEGMAREGRMEPVKRGEFGAPGRRRTPRARTSRTTRPADSTSPEGGARCTKVRWLAPVRRPGPEPQTDGVPGERAYENGASQGE